MSIMVLERFAYHPIWPNHLACTLGNILLPSGRVLATIERPWLKNERGVSCIPEGIYKLNKRYSQVVRRSTRGAFEAGWEVRAVPNRTFIMIHPANWASELEGCISVGLQHAILNGKLAVSDSFNAFKILMTELDENAEHSHELHIRPFLTK